MSNYLAVLTLDPLLRLFQYQGRCFAVFYQFFHLCVKLLAVTCKEVKNDVNLVNIVFWVHLFKRFPHLSIFLLFLNIQKKCKTRLAARFRLVEVMAGRFAAASRPLVFSAADRCVCAAFCDRSTSKQSHGRTTNLPSQNISTDSQQHAQKTLRLLSPNVVIIARKQLFLELTFRENCSWPLDQTLSKVSSRYDEDGGTGELSGKICPVWISSL